MISYTSGACELVRHVGAAPTSRVWKTRMYLLHQCRNEMVAGVGSAPTSADFQPAAHLSEPSSDIYKMVPRRGDAPRSLAYRASALLLSYRGMKLAEHQRITLWTPCGRSGFQDRFLVYAGRAPSLKLVPTPGFEPGTSTVRSGACRLSVTPCGLLKTGSSGWIRTITAALTERHPTVRLPRILNWWTRTVTLRRLLCAKQPCCLLSLRAL